MVTDDHQRRPYIVDKGQYARITVRDDPSLTMLIRCLMMVRLVVNRVRRTKLPKRATGLTARQVQTKGPGLYADGGGLYLRVTPTLARMWLYRFQLNGQRRDMGLGAVDLFSLAEARQRALEARKLVADGTDPIEARHARRTAATVSMAKAMSFKECADAYIAAHRAGWRNPKHAAQWPATLDTYVHPHFGDLPVQVIDVGLVLKAVEPIWTEKPETAGRVRGRIESVLDWASARGHRTGDNPARWRGHLENLLPRRSKVRRVEHHAALPYGEIVAFITELRSHNGIAALALEFAILTAARTSEVLGARWPEIDQRERLWTVPPERMKAAKEHRVPLSDAAMAIVKRMASVRQGEFVFPGTQPGRPMSNMAMLMVLRRMKRGDLTAHGFRSTFSDWCAERTAFPAEVREMALAHAVGDKVEAAYRRGDLFEKRRQLAEAWSSFCAGDMPDGKVIDLMRHAAR
jgi:integrase